MGVALGVFFGLLIPLAQIPITAAAAIVLRANLPAAAASTLITNPVTFAPIYYAAYELGSWITGETTHPASPPQLDQHDEDDSRSIWQRISDLGKPLLIGLAIMAVLAGLMIYVLIDLVWRWRIRSRWRERRRS